eukprot:4988532-Pleurochrysis_carterae.AAC.1
MMHAQNSLKVPGIEGDNDQTLFNVPSPSQQERQPAHACFEPALGLHAIFRPYPFKMALCLGTLARHCGAMSNRPRAVGPFDR